MLANSKPIYDIFFLYETSLHEKIVKLRENFQKKTEFRVYVDEEKNIENSKYSKRVFDETIADTRIIICFITKAFVATGRCKKQLMIAYTSGKTLVAIIVEPLDSQQMNLISYAFTHAKKFNFYEDPTALDTLDGQLFDMFVETLAYLLGYHREKKNKVETNTLESMLDSGDTITLKDAEDKMRDSKHFIEAYGHAIQNTERTLTGFTIPITTLIAEEKFISKDDVVEVLVNERDYIPKFRKLRSSSLIQSIYGLNRMTFLVNKNFHLITSSYRHSIAAVDINGTYIYKRSFGQLLQQPCGICTNGDDEIYVGDNGLRRILVIDFNLKYLKTIGDKDYIKAYDLAYDGASKELYAVDLYGSVITIFNTVKCKLTRKLYVPTPSFVRICKDQVFVLSMDYIFVLDRLTFDVIQTIQIHGSSFINGLHVDSNYNIYTTAHEVDEDENRSRYANLFVLRSTDKEIIKKVNLGLTQVNDFSISNDRMSFICDTHIDIFEYDGMGF